VGSTEPFDSKYGDPGEPNDSKCLDQPSRLNPNRVIQDWVQHIGVNKTLENWSITRSAYAVWGAVPRLGFPCILGSTKLNRFGPGMNVALLEQIRDPGWTLSRFHRSGESDSTDHKSPPKDG
jgi:hypothetical protein